MADGTDGFSQAVKVMEFLVVAGKGGHILGPRSEDEQRAIGAGFKAAALGCPILPNGVSLYMYQAQPLFQGHLFGALLAFRDAWGHQHVAAIGGSHQPLLFCCPVFSVLGAFAIGVAVEEDLVLLRLSKQEHIAKGTVACAANGDAQGTPEKIGVFAPHHVAERIVTEIALPVIQLAIAHEDVVVVIRFEEGTALLSG